MCCSRPFKSQGAHHRLCNACRASADDTCLYMGSHDEAKAGLFETAGERAARHKLFGARSPWRGGNF